MSIEIECREGGGIVVMSNGHVRTYLSMEEVLHFLSREGQEALRQAAMAQVENRKKQINKAIEELESNVAAQKSMLVEMEKIEVRPDKVYYL